MERVAHTDKKKCKSCFQNNASLHKRSRSDFQRNDTENSFTKIRLTGVQKLPKHGAEHS